MRPNRRLDRGAQAKDLSAQRKREGSEKALPRSGPVFRWVIFDAIENPESPPLPAMTFSVRRQPVSAPPEPGDTGETMECLDTTGFPANANSIVNLTLTAQRRDQTASVPPAAWTLQSPSCTTETGTALARSRTDVSASRRGQDGLR